MTIEEIKSLKDKIYEIEGLLELAQLREEKIPELEPLILGRINTLLDEPQQLPEPATETESELEPEPAEEADSEPGPAVGSETFVYGERGTLFDSEVFSETPVKDTAAIEMPYEVPVVETPVSDEVEIETEASPAVRTEYKNASSGILDDMTPREKPAFCLNDRFRFRRELFGNSDADFSSAMNMIAAMDGYDDAEEYFIDTLGWDPENPEVADFMDIIKGYFESQRR